MKIMKNLKSILVVILVGLFSVNVYAQETSLKVGYEYYNRVSIHKGTHALNVQFVAQCIVVDVTATIPTSNRNIDMNGAAIGYDFKVTDRFSVAPLVGLLWINPIDYTPKSEGINFNIGTNLSYHLSKDIIIGVKQTLHSGAIQIGILF